jgi:hypothetical protein
MRRGTGVPERSDGSRRDFARRFFADARRVLGELRLESKPIRRLHDIAGMSFEQLRELGAIVSPGIALEVRDGVLHSVRAAPAGACDPGRVMECSPANMTAFNLFDGRHPLGEIAATLAERMSWDALQAEAHVRALFVELVRQGVCVPSAVDD